MVNVSQLGGGIPASLDVAVKSCWNIAEMIRRNGCFNGHLVIREVKNKTGYAQFTYPIYHYKHIDHNRLPKNTRYVMPIV